MAALHTRPIEQRWTSVPSILDALILSEIDRAETAALRAALLRGARSPRAQADAAAVFEALTGPSPESALVSVAGDGLTGALARAEWSASGAVTCFSRFTWLFVQGCVADCLSRLLPCGALLTWHADDGHVLLIGMGALNATSELRALMRLGGTQR